MSRHGTSAAVTAPGRAYDHLYDTTYAVSGARDFARSATRGVMAAVAPVMDGVNQFSGEGNSVAVAPCHFVRLARAVGFWDTPAS